MGTGKVIINVAWKVAVLAIYAGLYELTPLRLDPHGSTACRTRTGCSGPATSSTTRAGTTTCRPPCARHGFAPWMVLLAQSWSLDRNYGGILVIWDRLFGWNDVRMAATWRERAGHLWHGPGWRPEENPAG
jgi:hypothetical protein